MENKVGLQKTSSNNHEFKCTICGSIIGNVTVGCLRMCTCANEMTISNIMGRTVIKAHDLDYVEEKNVETGDFYNLVF
jgi:hypothetical protein